MGRIYCVMGKSASGKDSIYHEVMKQEPELLPIVPYTTRPIRQGEIEGREYHFCDETRVEELEKAHRIIELRAYDTVYGIWKYFTVADEHIDLATQNYLYIVTLEGYEKMRSYFGADKVVPIYIEVEDGQRLMRAIERERRQGTPKYEEMCRRFLADTQDFSEEKIRQAGISHRFSNMDGAGGYSEIEKYLRSVL